MLKFKNTIIPKTEDISIDLKGRIYNVKTNETIKTYICRGREYYKGGYGVHVIQISTNDNTWFPSCEVHHLDCDKLNNALSNLICVTQEEHLSVYHSGENAPNYGRTDEKNSMYGKKHSAKTKQKIREACIGCHWWNNGIEDRFCKECPEGFVHGRLRRNNK